MPTPEYYIKNGHECQECIDMITADSEGGEAFIIGNIIKYLWRYKGKNGYSDLDKAITYIEMLKNKDKIFYNSKQFTFNPMGNCDYIKCFEEYIESIRNIVKKHCNTHDKCTECLFYGSEFYKRFHCYMPDIPLKWIFNEPFMNQIFERINKDKNNA